jgi:hypothetical protein
MCVNKLLSSCLARGMRSRSSTWKECDVSVYTRVRVLLIDVDNVSSCLSALSLS